MGDFDNGDWNYRIGWIDNSQRGGGRGTIRRNLVTTTGRKAIPITLRKSNRLHFVPKFQKEQRLSSLSLFSILNLDPRFNTPAHGRASGSGRGGGVNGALLEVQAGTFSGWEQLTQVWELKQCCLEQEATNIPTLYQSLYSTYPPHTRRTAAFHVAKAGPRA